ncbi:MAG: tRNA (N6-threonylcarbamoyladenosine(37)-N6)-methyltransferase TrmO [Candidatus Hermodarchaeota archaeon]
MPVEKIQIEPIGFIERTSNNEDVKDRSLISKVVVNKDLNKALDGIEDFSHIFIIFWMHQISKPDKPILHHPSKIDSQPVGIFATRAPIRPNPIGLTLVELLNREKNVLWVKGLDAYDGTPILDIKPYPNWERGRFIVVTDFKVPTWLMTIVKQH